MKKSIVRMLICGIGVVLIGAHAQNKGTANRTLNATDEKFIMDTIKGGRQEVVMGRLAVEKALQQLPEDQREVVVLKVFQGLKFEEIAGIQGAPVSTVKSRLYMGFEKLRGILGHA